VSIYQYKSIGASFKDIDQSTMTVSGYLSAFDKVDSYGEVAVKGSFSKSLNENKERIRYLLNHDVNKSLGPFEELKEDDYGLFYMAKVLPTSFGKDFMIMAEGGIIKEHSIGYKEMQSKEEKGVKYITEHKLFEGSSLTGWGVNQFTPMTSVSKSESEIQDRIKQLEAFIKNTTATDETIYLLMLEIKQLSQLVIDMKATKPETSTLPEKKIDLVKIALLLNT
jgi:HK97 family phage prohead protease